MCVCVCVCVYCCVVNVKLIQYCKSTILQLKKFFLNLFLIGTNLSSCFNL